MPLSQPFQCSLMPLSDPSQAYLKALPGLSQDLSEAFSDLSHGSLRLLSVSHTTTAASSVYSDHQQHSLKYHHVTLSHFRFHFGEQESKSEPV